MPCASVTPHEWFAPTEIEMKPASGAVVFPDEGSPNEGAMAIVGAAYARSYAARFKPRRDGNRLSVSLEVSMGTATVASSIYARSNRLVALRHA